MSKPVFVSYRRVASSDASLLVTKLDVKLPKDSILFDVGDIGAGDDYWKRIENDIRASTVMLVVIDPLWIDLKDEEGNRRLDNPEDIVRREIEIALGHSVKIIPVLVSGAAMPDAADLPESLRPMCRMNAWEVRHPRYDDDIAKLHFFISRHIPGRLFSFFDAFADRSVAPLVLSYVLVTGLILFIGRMLNIHQMFHELFVETNFAGSVEIRREVGLLLAVNWTIFVFLITPLLLLLFHGVMRDAKRLLQSMQLRKMIVYIDPNNNTTPVPSRTIWAAVLRPSTKWFAVIFALAMVLGFIQWYQYSGQWFFGGVQRDDFQKISTGVDWNIGWFADPTLAADGWKITSFALLFYLLYGVGWALTFSFYIFLFFFFSELEDIASSTGSQNYESLRLYADDWESGGFGLFYKIQSQHAMFCTLSVIAMFAMSLRNSYLPPYCNAPAELQAILAPPELLAQCSSMVGFTARLFHASEVFIVSLFSGHPAWRLLFFEYTDQNTFILGSAFQIALIGAFFYYVSFKMQGIVDAARRTSETPAGANLLADLGRQNTRSLLFIVTGGVATVFLNFVFVPALLFVVLLVTDKAVRRTKRRDT